MERREKLIIVGALLAVSALAWAATVRQAGGIGIGLTTMSMTMGLPFSFVNAAVYLALWGVMMVAMMFPSVAPMAVLFATVSRQKREYAGRFAPAWVFVGGYAVLWTLTGGIAYAGDLAIQSLPDTFPELRAYGPLVGGLVLIVAGLYQLTPFKYRCLAKCRSPLGFLLNEWRDGRGGAFRMGLSHGAYCLGCCWSLMAVLFVVGTMNLLWMGVLTLLIFLEKMLPHGVAFGKGTGIVLIGIGGVMATQPHIVLTL